MCALALLFMGQWCNHGCYQVRFCDSYQFVGHGVWCNCRASGLCVLSSSWSVLVGVVQLHAHSQFAKRGMRGWCPCSGRFFLEITMWKYLLCFAALPQQVQNICNSMGTCYFASIRAIDAAHVQFMMRPAAPASRMAAYRGRGQNAHVGRYYVLRVV